MSKAARIGKREEMGFEEEVRTWAGVWISDKLPRNGDFILRTAPLMAIRWSHES